MGMDVYGIKPHDEKGNYFRNTVWGWRPLWAYCCKVEPVANKVRNGYTNDGDGLDARDSQKLAATLIGEITSGRCADYAKQYEARRGTLPRERCELCNGTGVRNDNKDMATRIINEPPDHPRLGKIGWCNKCDGVGTTKAWASNYPFSVENVEKFAEFLERSGGCSIC